MVCSLYCISTDSLVFVMFQGQGLIISQPLALVWLSSQSHTFFYCTSKIFTPVLAGVALFMSTLTANGLILAHFLDNEMLIVSCN